MYGMFAEGLVAFTLVSAQLLRHRRAMELLKIQENKRFHVFPIRIFRRRGSQSQFPRKGKVIGAVYVFGCLVMLRHVLIELID